MNAEQLAAGLRAWARDDRFTRAAVELLAGHGEWLDEPEFVKAAIKVEGDDFARIVWPRAAAYAEADVSSSASRMAVLRTAILLGSDEFRFSSLDRANKALVVTAFMTALT